MTTRACFLFVLFLLCGLVSFKGGEYRAPFSRIASRKHPHMRGAAPESDAAAGRLLRPARSPPAQEPPDREADPASCRARPSGRNRAGTGLAGTGQLQPAAGQEPGRNRAGAGQQPHGHTTPTQNWTTLVFAAIFQYFSCTFFASAEERLTTWTRTCRGRAPETSPDHRTRQIAPLRYAGASYGPFIYFSRQSDVPNKDIVVEIHAYFLS